MTEAEWLACEDPQRMLYSLRESLSARKLRLFAVACAGQVRRLLSDQRGQAALAFAEKHGAEVARRQGRQAIEVAAQRARNEAYHQTAAAPAGVEQARWRAAANALDAAAQCVGTDAFNAARYSASFSAFAGAWAAQLAAGLTSSRELEEEFVLAEQERQVCFLRDLVGNDRRHVAVERRWLTETVAALAEAVYTDRAFDRLPILADALEDAGCTDRAMLDHCRQPGEHARGCWVVDLVLGKE